MSTEHESINSLTSEAEQSGICATSDDSVNPTLAKDLREWVKKIENELRTRLLNEH